MCQYIKESKQELLIKGNVYNFKGGKGNAYNFKGGNSFKIFLPPFWKGIYSKWEEFAPSGEQILSF